MRPHRTYRRTEVEIMANSVYVVQAWHYARFTAYETGGNVRVDILDEDDVESALVAVRPTLEEAEKAAEEWVGSCVVDEDGDGGLVNWPIAAVNICEVRTDGAPEEGRNAKAVKL